MSDLDEKQGFDYRTEIKDKKGLVVKEQHYRSVMKRMGPGETLTFLERPIMSGIWHNVDGSLLDDDQIEEYGLETQETRDLAAKAAAQKVAELQKKKEAKLAALGKPAKPAKPSEDQKPA